MKLTWITDIHLNFIEFDARRKYYQSITDSNADAVLISGDIAEAPNVSDMLVEMVQHIGKEIYFVLGNHDYYRSSVTRLRKDITDLCKKTSHLHWLPQSKVVKLTKNSVLVGEDCWADGRYGNYTDSNVILNDSRMIKELYEASMLGKYQLLDAMQKLADTDAERLQQHLKSAIQWYNPDKIVVLIHVSPFKESCMHEGTMSNDNYLPFFSSKTAGDVLLDIAKLNPDRRFLVLCGHTHSRSYYQPCANLIVKVGSVKYMDPEIQEVIVV